ncbi:MAG: hypothetical protein ACX94C_05320 [Phycisphaerales bacterium]
MQLGPNASTEQQRILNQGESNAPGELSAQETQQSEPMGLLERFNAENSMLPNLLLMGGMIVLVFLMMRALRKTHKTNSARTNAMGSPSERIEEIRQNAQSSMEPAQKLMVEAEDIARRLGAVLDNKAARLELLIEEADEKLDQLNRAISEKQVASQTKPLEPSDATPNQPPKPTRAIDPSLLDRARLEQDQHERDSRVAGRIAPEPRAEERVEEHPVAGEPLEVSISDQIHELSRSGKSSQEIAHELKQPIGQVELILNLQRRSEMR